MTIEKLAPFMPHDALALSQGIPAVGLLVASPVALIYGIGQALIPGLGNKLKSYFADESNKNKLSQLGDEYLGEAEKNLRFAALNIVTLGVYGFVNLAVTGVAIAAISVLFPIAFRN